MIFTDRTIMVKNGTSSINDTIVLYRGDREVEIRFSLNEGSPFKFGSGSSPNIIEKTEATYGQLVIKTPGNLPPIFSEVAPTIGGKIIFTITAEMIDEITEIGNYTFQIRLLDDSMESRATLPEVKNGIEIREPIALEDISSTNEVEAAAVGYALTTAGVSEDTFDGEGNYNKTTWVSGDRITAAKLNKMEAGIDEVNKKVTNVNNIDDTTASTTTTYSSNKIETLAEVERKRIDALTSLSEARDAELIDARIGADGVTYENLGSGVRSQFSNINKNFKNINLLNKCESFEDGCVVNNLEEKNPHESFCCMKYIPVQADITYKCNFSPRFTVFYNSSKTFLEGYGSETEDAPSVFTPTEDGFVTISLYKAEKDIAVVYDSRDNLANAEKFGERLLSNNVILTDNSADKAILKNLRKNIMISDNLLVNCEFHENEAMNDKLEVLPYPKYSWFKVSIKKGVEYNTTTRCRFLVITNLIGNIQSCSHTDEVFDRTTFTPEENGYAYITVYNDDLLNCTVALYETGKNTNLVKPLHFNLADNILINSSNIGNVKDGIDASVKEILSENICTTNNLLTFAEFHENEFMDRELNATPYEIYSWFKVRVKKDVEYSTTIRCRFLVIVDDFGSKQSCSYEDEVFDKVTFTPEKDGYAYMTVYNTDLATKLVALHETSKSEYVVAVGKYKLNNNIVVDGGNGAGSGVNTGNILYGKKWVACGDSFTEGGYNASDGIDETVYKYQDGIYKGRQITYPYIIGLRNNMTIINEAVSGSTMTVNSSASSGSFADTRYKNIPADADYITLYFGINDDNYSSPVGTINDTDVTTFYGAWNTVLEHIITTHPYAKIGIIITNGSNPKYTEAERNIAKKWGIPTLDLEMDYNVPLMHRATERPELCDKVKQLRMNSFRISSDNTHPNVKAHEYESTFIENWLRSL